MSKNKNRQQYRPTSKNEIDNENVMNEEVSEVVADEETKEEFIEAIVDEMKEETIENKNNIDNDVEETIVETTEETQNVEETKESEEKKVVNDVVENSVKSNETIKNTKLIDSGKYIVYVLKDGSPLQLHKVLNRLNSLGIPYRIENENSIITNTCNSESEAIKIKKYLAGKGLKPIIKK